MKLLLSRVLLIIAVVCLVGFCSVTGSHTQTSTDSSATVWRVGLSFSPWLTVESHSGNPGGSFHSGMDFHIFSWSTLALVLAIALWRLHRSFRHEVVDIPAPSQGALIATSASANSSSCAATLSTPDIMNEPSKTTEAIQPEVEIARERTNQTRAAGWTATFAAFFATMALAQQPTWPVAVGVAAIAAMVAVICYAIIKRH